jgi:hypothetical protein
MNKTILCIGDSHSYTFYGKSWPDYLSEKLGYNLIRASSPGAGNSFYIEKLHAILKESKIDLVVIQLSEPSRITLGIQYFENTDNTIGYDHPQAINDIGCYTFNAYRNNENLRRYSLISNDSDIDEFWLRQVSVSKWVDYKVMQDLMTMQFLCDQFKVPVIFWSWFVPMEELFIKPYEWLKDKINYTTGCAFHYILENKISIVTPDDHHLPPASHEILVDSWLLDKINKKLEDMSI